MDNNHRTNILESLVIDPVEVTQKCVDFLKTQLSMRKKDGICIGLSGGIDSATTMFLSVLATEDPKKVYAFHLYDKDSGLETRERAQTIAELKGINYQLHDTTSLLEKRGTYKPFWVKLTSISASLNRFGKAVFYRTPRWFKKRLGVGRTLHDTFQTKHGVRRQVLEEFCEENNLMLVGAGNRSEGFGGWFTYKGIDDVEIEPLFMLYKTQIYQLAEHLGVPSYVIEAKATADMLKGLGDEDLMDLDYETVDKIAYICEYKLGEETLKAEGIAKKVYERIKKRHVGTEWKRVNPHVYPLFD